MKKEQPINVRKALKSDSNVLSELLNEIIIIGGSTAFESPLSASEFDSFFLCGSSFICCHVAENSAGEVLGFQSLTRHPELPIGWADIATFARANPKVFGVGTALFQKTVPYARDIGIATINATIRADNVSGLSYYSKIGFLDYSVANDVPLNDGTLIDRISKKFKVSIN
jgi:GNAT superfamily N-acetyltransferase